MMIEDLISPSDISFIRECFQSTIPQEKLMDEDQFPLGNGIIATFYADNKVFFITKNGEYLGKIRLRTLLET